MDLVSSNGGPELDLQSIPLDDPKTFELLSAGETTDVFQLEGSGMRRYIRDLRPNNFRDIAAMVALYRPGPMEHIDRYIPRQARRGGDPLPAPFGQGIPGGDLRGHRLPGPGAAHRAAVCRVHARAGGCFRKAMGKKVAAIMAQEKEVFLKARWSAATRRRKPMRCSSSLSPSPGTPSTRPTPSATRSSRTGTATSRRTTPSST